MPTTAVLVVLAAPSKDFVEVLNNLWWRLDKKLSLDDCYYSALVPLVDAIPARFQGPMIR